MSMSMLNRKALGNLSNILHSSTVNAKKHAKKIFGGGKSIPTPRVPLTPETMRMSNKE